MRKLTEGNTAAAIPLVLDRRDEAGGDSAVAGGDGGSVGKERLDVSLRLFVHRLDQGVSGRGYQ